MRATLLFTLLIACFAGILTGSLPAQTKPAISFPDLSTLRPDLSKSAPGSGEIKLATPMDAPVDPAEYYVGPGDQLSLNIWSSSPVEHRISVTPEATLLIPNVGSVSVKDLSLAKVKDLVGRMTASKYVNAEISVTLLVPRKIVVTVLGSVLEEGRTEVTAVQRVNDVIDIGNRLDPTRMTHTEYAEELLKMRHETSERNIVIKGRNGDIRRADLAKYRATGQGIYNPYLREGDIVYVPQRGDLDNSIAVFGGVLIAANFEYVPDDSLSGLIAMALGFNQTAEPEHAFLTRLSADGRMLDTLHVDARAVLQRKAPDVRLRPGDRLVIPHRPELRKNYRVGVAGEVLMPGTYPIGQEGTRLSEVIRMAGGFTENANIRAASLVRNGLRRDSPGDELANEQLSSRRTSLPVQDSSYYFTETALRLKGEAVSVDFYKLFVEGDTTQDVVMRPYDRIQVPPAYHSIYVFGQVVSPGHIAYASGKGYQEYIEEAGGFTAEARTGGVMVIKGSNRTWLDPGETAIEDGDYIWVPKEPYYPFSYYLSTWAQIAGIVGTVATIALLVNSLK